MTFNELICQYSFQNQQIVKILVMFHSRFNEVEIYQNIDQEIDFNIIDFNYNLKQYLSGKPLEYILGYKYFFNYKFMVSPDCFIPRSETEQLVENTLYEMDRYLINKKLTIVDVCSGSGAIAITLNLETNQKTYGLELSKTALVISRKNNNRLRAKVIFKYSNTIDYLILNKIKVDVLIANPPYIKFSEILPAKVIDYEPHLALFGSGENGLKIYEQIFQKVIQVLNDKALLAFEFGYDQKLELELLVKKYFPYKKYSFQKDFNNLWRMLFIYY